MQGIPIEYLPRILAKMGNYSIKMEEVEVKVKVVDICFTHLLETHINDMIAALKTSSRVVGFHSKYIHYSYRVYNMSSASGTSIVTETIGESLVLCAGASSCLIINLPSQHEGDFKIPEVLKKFLDDPTICFVGANERKPSRLSTVLGVNARVLAPMLLQKPTIARFNLKETAREVGVQYGLSPGNGEIKVDMKDPIVMSPDQVKLAVSEAYVAYQIGQKLLSSL